jgi:hypothetical protein
MNDAAPQDPQRKKRLYEKPQLVQVPLRPEEAVLGSCKTTSHIGPGASGCKSVSPCYGIGS